MIYAPVAAAIRSARDKIRQAREESQTAEATPLHDAFETLRLAVDDLADALDDMYEAAALEEQGR